MNLKYMSVYEGLERIEDLKALSSYRPGTRKGYIYVVEFRKDGGGLCKIGQTVRALHREPVRKEPCQMASTKNLKAVPTTGTMPRLDTKKIPKAERANIGQLVFDAIQREFQNPEIRAEYERWKADRAAKGIA